MRFSVRRDGVLVWSGRIPAKATNKQATARHAPPETPKIDTNCPSAFGWVSLGIASPGETPSGASKKGKAPTSLSQLLNAYADFNVDIL